MTVDGNLTAGEGGVEGATSAGRGVNPADVVTSPAAVPRAAVLGYACLGVLLMGWFLFGALVQRQGVVNSAGEALGTGFALLLAVSIVGMARDRGA